MGDCYIVRRGGNGESTPTNDFLFSLDTVYINYGTIPPVNDVIIGGKIADETILTNIE